MNEVIKTINNHRSNRSFVKGYKLHKEELDIIIKSSKQAPSWMNGQHYSIVVIDDEDLKNTIWELSKSNIHISTSSVFLLYCADLTRHKLSSEKHFSNFNIEDNLDTIITATTDVALAMQNAVLAAESLGYGTVCCGAIRSAAKELIEILEMPKYTYPICGISI
ncbi:MULTISPECIES: nitroreductase family protein [unclassified Gemella]|uniref:nitroreductase family protein n=1 Tax=unclassified Gemella TaxID=2624949 RepID=UPI00207B85CA|nr:MULTISPECIES: nitroreductase family protein [unclassified Gemella]